MRTRINRPIFASILTITALGLSFFSSNSSAQAAGANPMTLEFQTFGMYETLSITLGGELSNVVINWGDLDGDSGTAPVIQTVPDQAAGSADISLQQYPDFDGTYQVTITATKIDHFGKCVNGGDSNLKRVTTWGSFGLTSLQCAFNHKGALREVPSVLPSTVTDLSYAFAYANAFNQDLSGWDTSNVTNMDGMFENAVSFNQSLASWDVSNVSSMSGIFKKINFYSMSNENYSATLASWGAQSIQPNINMGNVSTQVVTCAGIQGRSALLASPNNWTINDVAPTLDCEQNNNQNNSHNSGAQSSAEGAQLAQTGGGQNIPIAVSVLMMITVGIFFLEMRRNSKTIDK